MLTVLVPLVVLVCGLLIALFVLFGRLSDNMFFEMEKCSWIRCSFECAGDLKLMNLGALIHRKSRIYISIPRRKVNR